MDGQDTISTLFRAISDAEIQTNLSDQLTELRQTLADAFHVFRAVDITPETTHQFECRIERIVRATARSFLQWCLTSLEPEQTDSMPGTIRYRDNSYRRLSGKTRHANILTRFGNITLLRAVYRRGSRGKVIAPLEKALGIERGTTPGAADLVGRQVAATGSSQNRCVEVIADRMGVKIGHEKLRKLSTMLAGSMEPHREVCQCEQLQRWIDEAEKNGKNIVLSVSRDGVSLGIAPFGYFEMASVATLSVFSEGKRVVDYYHASERLTIIADSFKLSTKQRCEWLDHVRKLLLAEGGWGRVLRSIAKMEELYGVKKTKSVESEKAKRYLRRYRRFMNYAEQRGRSCPIGSGIVESACKQIVSERMKLSGMRWKRVGAQHVMSLRSILLSQTMGVGIQTHVRRISASRRS